MVALRGDSVVFRASVVNSRLDPGRDMPGAVSPNARASLTRRSAATDHRRGLQRGDESPDIRERRRQIGELMTRVQPARIGQHPDFRCGRRLRLVPHRGPGALEGRPVRADPEHGEAGRPYRRSFRANRRPPRRSSSALSSAAVAVARATRFVMPSPQVRSSPSSQGRSSRPVKPPACRAGQKRFPGRAKW
jgi:hypothetical protein